MNENKKTAAPMSWVTTWGTAEENFVATPEGMPRPLADTTVRQIVRVTTAGDEMKLRLSNRYGKSDVTIRSLHAARQIKADQSTIDLYILQCAAGSHPAPPFCRQYYRKSP